VLKLKPSLWASLSSGHQGMIPEYNTGYKR
jgi:hypothetical protein